MEQGEIAVGLDIGTTKIVSIVGRKNELGKLDILGFGKAKSLGVQRGVVSNYSDYKLYSVCFKRGRRGLWIKPKTLYCWNRRSTHKISSTQ
jgi:hypothetical protein